MKMTRTRGKCCLLIAGLVLAVTACGEEPTGPDSANPDLVAAFAKPGGKPGGGGKPSGDIPLEVTFADGADGIRSDGLGHYFHKQDFVSAQIKDSGQFYFQAFDGKRRDPVTRRITVDLSLQEGSALSPADLEAFVADVGVEWPVFTSDVTLHTRNTSGGLLTLNVGSTLVDGGKIAFNDYGDGWEWRLLFDTKVAGVNDGVGLCLTRESSDTWLVTASEGVCEGVDGITELWRVQGGVFTHVADFNTPMHLTLKGN